MKKTNAARLLDTLGIEYSLHETPVDENDLSAVSMARKLGADPEVVFKTLVLRGKDILLACIPAPAELDLKQLALVSGNKHVAMLPLKDVHDATGYLRGGCSPIACKKPYPVYVDESAILYERIYISAGQRGMQLFLSPDSLLTVVGGIYAAIARPARDDE